MPWQPQVRILHCTLTFIQTFLSNFIINKLKKIDMKTIMYTATRIESIQKWINNNNLDYESINLQCHSSEKGILFTVYAKELPEEDKTKYNSSLLTGDDNVAIAKKFSEYCLIDQNGKPFLGSRAIPLIFDECLKVLNQK